MKRTLIVTLAMLLSFSSSAVATDIADLAWNESNIETLRQFSKDAIVRFISEVPGIDANVATNHIFYFAFADLVGDGKYELIVTNSPGPCCTNLTIYWQDAPGRVRFESFAGGGDLKKTIRDLNGDGKVELILYSYLGSDGYRGAQPTPMWPKVFRRRNGKYVEASRDFPDFYSDEVLPQLDKEISKAQRLWPPGSPGEAGVAVLEMERDKILRMLGSNPTAGLEQARQWASSSDPELIRDASVVFRDLGGHDDEAHAAAEAWKRALDREKAARQGG